ncbi:glycosyl transferase family 2, partial [bacterium]|nr:glycosyl transferase family 2 [bacterium]
HYMKAKEVVNKYGLELCSEAGGPGQPLHNCPFEALRALGALDIPRGEFWNQHQVLDENGIDVLWLVKEIACASHIYGKKIVDGEAFTSWFHWQEGPFDLKPLADRAMCGGLNLFTFHTGSHNPPEAGKPGWSYHAGTHICPSRVWWPKIKPFNDYLARSCYLLQEGLFVGDVLYYYGDEAPNFVKPKHVDPSLGYGFDYDVTNSEVILTRMDVKDGKIVLPDGMSYEILVMPDREDANPEVLLKIKELIEKGATVVGAKPTRANGLTDYPNRDEQVKRIANELWVDCDGEQVKERAVGKGKIICGRTLKEVLRERGIGPDFGFSSSLKDTELDYIHRRTDNEDVYFIYNTKMRWEEVDCTFRVENKVPELWIPDTGEMKKNLVFDSVEGGTKVSLRLPPGGSVFVVFRERSKNNIASVSKDGESIFPVSFRVPGDVPSVEVRSMDNTTELLAWEKGTYVIKTGSGKEEKITVKSVPEDILVTGSWEVKFPTNWGAPPSAVFPELMSWTEHFNDGVKYFSGIASYCKEIEIPAELVNPGSHLELDLGRVELIADVYLNGHNLGILWKPPYRVDITDFAKPGKNRLVVEIANTWSNRIVGDTKLPRDQRYTVTNMRGPGARGVSWKDAPLLESGLLGPVRVLT